MNSIICEHCRESTQIEAVAEKDICSNCGAEVDVSAGLFEEQDFSVYDEDVEVIKRVAVEPVETVVESELELTERTIEQEKIWEKKVSESILGQMRAVASDHKPKSEPKTKKKSSSYLSKSRKKSKSDGFPTIIKYAILLMFLFTTLTMFGFMPDNTYGSFPPIYVNEPSGEEIKVLLQISVIDLETGNFTEYNGQVEIREAATGDIVLYAYYVASMFMIEIELIEGKNYVVWIFPYGDRTHESVSFTPMEGVAIECVYFV